MLKEILASLEGLTDLERAEVLRTLMSGQTVLQKVKTLLGITTEDQDDVLEYVIQTVQTLVLRYINWDELPLELENVLAVMCVSYYKAAGLGTTAAAPRRPSRSVPVLPDRPAPSTWETTTGTSSAGRRS